MRPALALLALPVVAACARMSAPPGGPEDRIPPQVVSTDPDTFAVLEGARGDAAVFRFNERISERAAQGALGDAVVVSPRTGRVSVAHGGSALEVSLEGGFREGLVYRITVLPQVRDLFSNIMLEPFELVFSTGGPLVPNTLAGIVTDRITGQPVQGARVNAVARDPGPDTLVHTAVTDTGGVYALRYVPGGAYELTAFEDRNRDGALDDFEPRGREEATLATRPDTSITGVRILAPDTTPARLVRVPLVDSTALRLETDDHLDPTAAANEVRVRLGLAADTAGAPEPPPDVPVPTVDSVFHLHRWQRRLAVRDSLARARASREADSLGAIADTLAAAGDSARADSLRARAQRVTSGAPAAGARGGEGPGQRGATGPRGEPLPSQALVALLDGPLAPGVGYRVTVEGLVNVNGLPGGGGERVVVRELPPDTAAADSAAADAVPGAAGPGEAPPPDSVPGPDAIPAGDTIPAADTLRGAGGGRGAPDAPPRGGRDSPPAAEALVPGIHELAHG